VVEEKAPGRRDGAFRLRTGVYLHHSGIAGGAGVKVGLPRDVATLLAAQTTFARLRWCSRPATIRRY